MHIHAAHNMRQNSINQSHPTTTPRDRCSAPFPSKHKLVADTYLVRTSETARRSTFQLFNVPSSHRPWHPYSHNPALDTSDNTTSTPQAKDERRKARCEMRDARCEIRLIHRSHLTYTVALTKDPECRR
ncbi:hypothetical protein EYC84_001682 [Monilinia fructicola]|uniref:Uncharacterized protein n=1 Tax=Monilinia fructicola TaxID=38448 RepID=A0A5M9JR08_MONFR|nr:hypothetical protein EYC84_001682 [Monilinia fructicola]